MLTPGLVGTAALYPRYPNTVQDIFAKSLKGVPSVVNMTEQPLADGVLPQFLVAGTA